MCRRSSPWRATDLSPDETWSATLRGKVRGEPSGATAGVPGCCGSPHCHCSGRGTNIWQVIRQRLPCSPVPSPPLPVPARNGRKDSAALRVMDQALTGNSPPPQGSHGRGDIRRGNAVLPHLRPLPSGRGTPSHMSCAMPWGLFDRIQAHQHLRLLSLGRG